MFDFADITSSVAAAARRELIVGLSIVLALVCTRCGRTRQLCVAPPVAAGRRHAWFATYVLVGWRSPCILIISGRISWRTIPAMVVANYAIAALRGFAAALVVVSLS